MLGLIEQEQESEPKNQNVRDVLKMQVDPVTTVETVTNDLAPAEVVAFNPNTETHEQLHEVLQNTQPA